MRSVFIPSLSTADALPASTAASKFSLWNLLPLLAGLNILAICITLPWRQGPLLSGVGIGASLIVIASSWRYRLLERQLIAANSGRAAQAMLMRLDPLTQLQNRSAFNAALDDLSVDGRTIILIYFDLDRFKDVNDTMGHKIGDLLLVEVAQRTTVALGGATMIARLGGDEFAAILPMSEAQRPEEHGLAIVEAMCQPFLIEDKLIDIGASVGIAVGDPSVYGAHELLRRADSAMYEAKGTQQGGCRVFDDALDSQQILERSIRIELGDSMIQNQLALHYQPIVDARTGALSSAEALLRWHSTKIGDVTPSTLIPVAEESGQIIELTDWTIETALDAIGKLNGLSVAVNISPIYFKHPDFVQRVFDKMLLARVKPEFLSIELTEGVLISNFDHARKAIAQLREVGLKVFLDDFGTGYSSLSYLQHFELDGLKLDKSFLRNAGKRPQATQLIRAVIEFGHSLNMRVVVEGVESDWQARLLQLLGCDLLQGYEIGVPMPFDQFQEFRQARVAKLPCDAETEMMAVNHLRQAIG
jgi:diguanylate cyclase (GGDEF)-like protein